MTNAKVDTNLLSTNSAPDIFVVSAILVVPDGRYLLQLRDKKVGLAFPDHWCLFGGHVEDGEDLETAVKREIREELGHTLTHLQYQHEVLYVLPQWRQQSMRKAYFSAQISLREFSAMKQYEGADMKLLHVNEIVRLTRISPWDLSAILIHARERILFHE